MKRHRQSDVRKIILADPQGNFRSFLGQREGIRSLPAGSQTFSPDLVLIFMGKDSALESRVISQIESLDCPVLAISDQADLVSLGKFLDTFEARWSEKETVMGR